MSEDALRTIEAQLNHTRCVVDNVRCQLQGFRFQTALDTLNQLDGELKWIQDHAKKTLKKVSP